MGKGDVRMVGDYPGRYDAHPHEPESYARWFDLIFVPFRGIDIRMGAM